MIVRRWSVSVRRARRRTTLESFRVFTYARWKACRGVLCAPDNSAKHCSCCKHGGFDVSTISRGLAHKQ